MSVLELNGRIFDASTTGTLTLTGEGGAATTDVTQGLAKAWVCYNQATPAISDSINISSVSDNATGDYTTTFTSNMANANYSEAGMARTYHVNSSSEDNKTSSGDRHQTFYVSSTAGGRTSVDISRSHVVYHGDLA